MIFNSGDENTYLLYMIVYESLDQYRKAYKLYDDVQEEIDEIQFEEEKESLNSDNSDDSEMLMNTFELHSSVNMYEHQMQEEENEFADFDTPFGEDDDKPKVEAVEQSVLYSPELRRKRNIKNCLIVNKEELEFRSIPVTYKSEKVSKKIFRKVTTGL